MERELQKKRANLVKTSHDKLERLRVLFINNGGYDSMELRIAVEWLSPNNINSIQSGGYLLLTKLKLTELTARCKRLAMEYSMFCGESGNNISAAQKAETMSALSQAHREEKIMGDIIDALESAIAPIECVHTQK